MRKDAKKESSDDYAKGVIENSLKKSFAPEFLNRIDDVIVFNNLKMDDIHKIIDIELKGLYKRLEKLGYLIKLTDEAKDFIADKGYDAQFGARPIKRAIQKCLEDPLAEEIINASLNEGDKISVGLDKKKEKIAIKITKPKASKVDQDTKKDDNEKES